MIHVLCASVRYWSKVLQSTVMCLSIGTPRTINFPFVANVKKIFQVYQNLATLQPYYNVLKY